jgi:hypothetical protein
MAESFNGLDLPTPVHDPDSGVSSDSDFEEIVDVTGINPEDSADLTPENMQALLARAKQAGKKAVKKTRMAFDATKALADSGELKTRRFNKVDGGE